MGAITAMMAQICRGRSRRRGQALVEYVVVLAMIVASLAILVVFLIAFREYGGRIVELASSEYP